VSGRADEWVPPFRSSSRTASPSLEYSADCPAFRRTSKRRARGSQQHPFPVACASGAAELGPLRPLQGSITCSLVMFHHSLLVPKARSCHPRSVTSESRIPAYRNRLRQTPIKRRRGRESACGTFATQESRGCHRPSRTRGTGGAEGPQDPELHRCRPAGSLALPPTLRSIRRDRCPPW